jgi:hypothetical protein
MWLLVVLVVLVALVVSARWLLRSPRPSQTESRTSRPASSSPRNIQRDGLRQEVDAALPDILRQVDAEAARMMPEIEAEAARMMPEIEAEAARMMPEIEAEAARLHAEIMRGAAAEAARLEAESAADEDDEPESRRGIWREDYVPKDDEARYLTRDENGLPTVRLADAGDRLGIWSPLDGGGLINPKGPGLRQRLGLCTSYARGSGHYASAYRAADLRHGHWVDLRREPDNPHDRNAVAMCAPGSRVPFGYVGRGRAPSLARRMDSGEDMAGVTIWGPGRGSDDRSTLVLIGSRADLRVMLD